MDSNVEHKLTYSWRENEIIILTINRVIAKETKGTLKGNFT
jgi:hypothetical protein